MPKSIKYIIIFVLVIVLIGIIGFLTFLYAPKANVNNKKAFQNVTAIDLYSQFDTDEQASNAKYIGKIIAVKGSIGEMEEDENGSTVILLEAGEIGGVLCTLEKSQTEKGKTLTFGDTITIKGMCTGMLNEVILNKCIILEL